MRLFMNLERLTLLGALAVALLLASCRSGSALSQPLAWTMAVNPQFAGASDFSEGLAAVRVGGGDDGKWGFIDKLGIPLKANTDSGRNANGIPGRRRTVLGA